ncbi:MAG TPA: TIR domain-containing protein [Pyrinomonadaceae bacterium]|jgi:hypothetical protein
MIKALSTDSQYSFEYDVALSFAGEDRKIARELADHIRAYRLRVYFDEYEGEDTVGKNLYTHFKEIYSKKSLYFIPIISQSYPQKSWTFRVELPAAQERDFLSTEEYVLPLLLDDTEILGIEKTIGHIDLRKTPLDIAAKTIAKKVLKKHFTQPKGRKKSERQIDHRVSRFKGELSLSDTISLFCERMYNCTIGEIEYVAISASRLLGDLQFRATLEMFLEKMSARSRTVTFRFYILDIDSSSLQHFAIMSDESVESLKQKHEQSYTTLQSLITDKNRNILRIRVYFYSGLPSLNLIQIDNEYLFRPYKIGVKQGHFNVFHLQGNEDSNDFVKVIRNIIADLKFRSRQVDINWF